MSNWIKQGCYGELTPETAEGLRKVSKAFAARGEDLYITSLREGTHSPASFHPSGRAFDLRYPKWGTPQEVVLALHKSLGCDFDIVAEGNHLHIEYQP